VLAVVAVVSVLLPLLLLPVALIMAHGPPLLVVDAAVVASTPAPAPTVVPWGDSAL
jgi:hypothetical protein